MMKTRSAVLAIAMAISIHAAVVDRAHGQCGAMCGYAGYGGFWDIGRLYGLLADEVPYYAAFPPVYYSYPVPRTYGYSPFAYPPGVMTPEVEIVELQTIENPYFKGEEVPQPSAGKSSETGNAADQTAGSAVHGAPLVIDNPYVAPSGFPVGRSASPSLAQR
ncbi:MAG: hypothetical protein DCC67_13960 [Planctomycetota bacterium]|nr:MAG: hypothetical protein DCC67_13960 [Planctomycetota bacterium]